MNKFILKNKLLATTAICAIATFSNNAKAEVIPDPSTIAPDVITLTESSETTHSGNYIVLYDTDEGVNKYYDITLKTTTYGTGTPSTEYTAKVPYEDVTITVNGESDERINVPDEVDYGDIYDAFVYGKSNSMGGAIFNNNDAIIDNIKDAIFISNNSTFEHAGGGAIYNNGTISDITNSIFLSNNATYGGAAIQTNELIEKITYSDFISNSALRGGAIFVNNYTNIGEIKNSNFISNVSLNGGAIYNSDASTIGNILQSTFISNIATASGGAIYDGGGKIPNIIDSIFISNIAKNGNGGAIYTSTYSSDNILNIIANNSNVVFLNNTANGKANDIYSTGKPVPWDPSSIYSSILNFNTSAGKYIYLDGGIDGDATYLDYNIVNINKTVDDLPTAGTVYFNGDVKNQTINMYDGTLKLGAKDDIFENVGMNVYGGLIDTLNGSAGRMKFNSYNVLGAVALALDVDLEAKTMDHIEADKVDISSGTLNVTNFLLLSDATENSTQIPFIISDVVSGLENVTYSATANSNTTTYDVTFDTQTGQFVFVKQGNLSPEEVAPNQAPALTTTTTAATVETVVAQIFDRDVTISTDINYGADTTDYMETSDGVNIHNSKSVWVKTFGSDDDVEVDNFNSTIDAEAYGVVGGVDSKVFTYDNGVKAAYGVYGAYVGGKQKYNDSKIEQKSGYLGVSAAFRKSNLFSNFTLNGGYITSEANTEWGKDKFDTKVVSVANKTGVDIKTYNNWKITSALYVAYTGMDTEDYTNKAGVKMENEFSNVITIAPELKVRKGFDNGVGAYAKASYKHYIYDAEVRADDVLLEEMSAKPYVEYGFGVEKNWADKSGYAEITRRDGGREGWNVNLGLNFDF